MPNVSSPLGTTQPYIPAVSQSQIGRFAGLAMIFPSVADMLAAQTASSSVWQDGQVIFVAPEFIGGMCARVWKVTPGHARTVLLRPGLEVVLAADTNTLLFGAGAPSNGSGADGDVYVDWAGNAYYTKAAGAWASTGPLYPAGGAGGLPTPAVANGVAALNADATAVRTSDTFTYQDASGDGDTVLRVTQNTLAGAADAVFAVTGDDTPNPWNASGVALLYAMQPVDGASSSGIQLVATGPARNSLTNIDNTDSRSGVLSRMFSASGISQYLVAVEEGVAFTSHQSGNGSPTWLADLYAWKTQNKAYLRLGYFDGSGSGPTRGVDAVFADDIATVRTYDEGTAIGPTPELALRTGDARGSSNSGHITLQTGAADTGTRGQLRANARGIDAELTDFVDIYLTNGSYLSLNNNGLDLRTTNGFGLGASDTGDTYLQGNTGLVLESDGFWDGISGSGSVRLHARGGTANVGSDIWTSPIDTGVSPLTVPLAMQSMPLAGTTAIEGGGVHLRAARASAPGATVYGAELYLKPGSVTGAAPYVSGSALLTAGRSGGGAAEGNIVLQSFGGLRGSWRGGIYLLSSWGSSSLGGDIVLSARGEAVMQGETVPTDISGRVILDAAIGQSGTRGGDIELRPGATGGGTGPGYARLKGRVSVSDVLANGAGTVTLGNLSPAGALTVKKWLRVYDDAALGTPLYLPLFGP